MFDFMLAVGPGAKSFFKNWKIHGGSKTCQLIFCCVIEQSMQYLHVRFNESLNSHKHDWQ